MSEDPFETVRKLRDSFNAYMQGDVSSEELTHLLHPDVEYVWRDRRTYPDTPQHLRGVAEVVTFMEQFRDGWADLAQEPLEHIQAPGGRVVVLVRQTGRGRESGVPIEIHFFELCTIRDGKLRRAEYFRHRADALDAAELSE